MDNEGYTTCDMGHQHWGLGGAAGLMLHHQDENGTHRYLMQQRSPLVEHPDTWAPPSGALGVGEHPIQGALREAQEELGPFQSTNHQIAHTNDHGGWAFHTVSADTPHQFDPELDDESSDAAWLTPEEIDEMPLHPGFKESWNELRPPPQQKFAKDDGTPDELHVAYHIPDDIRNKIHRWAKGQDWPEGIELEDPSEYHITVMYSPSGRAEHKDADWIHKHKGRVDAEVAAFDNFTQTQDGSVAHVLHIKSDAAKEHAEAMQEEAKDKGLEITDFEGGYKPHLTVGYGKKKADLDPPKLSFKTEEMKVSEPRVKESAWNFGAVSAPAVPLYHWTDAANLHDWMDSAHTGPGETYLTEHGDAPDDSSWNPDVPMMNNPVRLTIDHSQLDPAGWDEGYHGWLNNYLYRGAIPPHAVTDVKAFPSANSWDQPEHWAKTKVVIYLPENEGKSTDPQEVCDPEDAWPEWGGLNNDQKTRDIQFGDSSTATI